MLSPSNLRIGDVYFLVGYYDRAFRLPFVETYVYVGEADGDSNGNRQWLFQAAADFSNLRSSSGVEERLGVIAATREALDGFFDLNGLVEELQEKLGQSS